MRKSNCEPVWIGFYEITASGSRFRRRSFYRSEPGSGSAKLCGSVFGSAQIPARNMYFGRSPCRKEQRTKYTGLNDLSKHRGVQLKDSRWLTSKSDPEPVPSTSQSISLWPILMVFSNLLTFHQHTVNLDSLHSQSELRILSISLH
jgi:hypothetical protein